jgi:GPH family glycoside/pentoside/hexuronide:cation symporter
MLSFSFLADKMVKTRGLKRVYLIGNFLASHGFLLLFLSGSWIATAMMSLVVVGVGLAPLLLTWNPIFADVMDYDEILTGKRRETTYAGVNALITKPAISIANAMFLLIISSYGFDNTLSVQPVTAIFGIQLAYALMPAVAFLISGFVFWRWYNLDGKDWTAKKVELGMIRLEKEKDYIAQLQREGKISKVYQKLYRESQEET